jgi:ubiquinone/menaquinone biosynthesis C-methylase UbiE
MNWKSVDRTCRSLLTLNRDREYSTLCKMLAFQKDDTLLDVGSGDGFWTARLAAQCAAVTGIEPDDELRGYAQTLYARPNVTYLKGTAERMPFQDATFDKIVSISCLEHFASPFEGLKEMSRVLKPGGRLAISVDSLLPENSSVSYRAWHKPRHFVTQYFSETELLDMIQQVGLRSEPKRTVHLFRSRAAAYIRQIITRRPRALLPLFPLSYVAVRLADSLVNDMHGQIVIVTAVR